MRLTEVEYWLRADFPTFLSAPKTYSGGRRGVGIFVVRCLADWGDNWEISAGNNRCAFKVRMPGLVKWLGCPGNLSGELERRGMGVSIQ